MFEKLGLGVTLSLEDDFTPKANNALDSFDRLQAGAESMVANVQKNMLQMRNLMMTGFTFQQMGEGIENTGKSLLRTLQGFSNEFIKVNANYQTLQSQLLTSFRGNMKEADEAFSWIRKYSAETPFEVQGLTDAFAKMKSTNMDLREQFKLSNGEVKTFAEAMGDLATRNMGATGGMENMGYAIQNAWAGQAKSLYDRFNFAKQDMDEMMKYAGKDSHKFMEEFVKLSQKLAPDAMRNMGGTWEQTMSNMDDMWKNFMYDVGKTGIFKDINKCLNDIQERLESVFSNKELIKGFGSAMRAIATPIMWIARGLTEVFVGIAKVTARHPAISKLVLGFLGLGGAILTVTGLVMKLAGGMLLAVSSFAILMMNMQLMTLTGVRMTSMFAGLSGVLTRFVSTLGIIGIAGAGIFYAWEKDIGGLQTKLTNFFNSVNTGWMLARRAMEKGASLDSIMKNYQFKAKINLPPLTKIFAGKFLKILALTKAFWQVFTGHFDKGKMHFSKKDWNLYKEAGIEGIVRGMVYARDKIDRFFDGLKQGLAVVAGVIKEFCNIIWKPIKVVLDSIDKYVSKYPGGILTKLYVGKAGVEKTHAQRVADMCHKIGKAIGLVVGAFASLKVLKWITPKILSPFNKLYKKLGDIGNRALDVRAKLSNLSNSGVKETIITKLSESKHSKYYGEVGRKVRDHFNKYDRTTKHRDGVAFRDGKYQNVSRRDIDDTYYNYFLKDKLNGEQIQVKRRTKLGKLMLGETYYKKSSNGKREKLGNFGGILRMDKDDRNIENRATSLFSDRPLVRENTVKGLTHRPVVGDTIGTLANLKGNENLIAEHKKAQEAVRLSAMRIRDVSTKEFNSNPITRQQEILKDIAKLKNNASTGGFSSVQDALRYKEYQKLGIDESNVHVADKILKTSTSGQDILNRLRDNRIKEALKDPIHQSVVNRAKSSSINKRLFADTKQGGLSRLLFGQKLYTVNKGKDGSYIRQNVGRRGGIFRKESGLVYKEEQDSFRAKISRTPLGISTRYVADTVKNSIGGITKATKQSIPLIFGGMGSRMKNTSVGRVASKFSPKSIGKWYNKQRARVGLAPKVPGEKLGFRGVVRKTGGFLFGSNIRNSKGEVIGRRRGLVQKVGRGAVKTSKGIFRGVGAMGGLFARALPVMALGKLAYSGISAKGAGVNRKKLGLDPKASNFQVGLKLMERQMSKVNFSKVWIRFGKEAKSCFRLVGKIARDAFKGLKPLLPKIMREAFNGIKGLAKIAWVWIQNDGMKVMSQLASFIGKIMVKTWHWITDNAGVLCGKIAKYIVGTMIPKIITGVIKLGIFIIKHIPDVLRGLKVIVLGIFKGIYEGVKQIFKGIARFLWNTFTNAVSGLGNKILNAIASPIRSVPVIGDKVANFLHLPAHHGGLWMSEDEHMAVIKKDETVLPPDKSKRLSDFLNSDNLEPRKPKGGKPLSTTKHIDNSITIKEVKINVQADKLSRGDARKQALMILDELKKIKRERQVRNHEDILSSDINL